MVENATIVSKVLKRGKKQKIEKSLENSVFLVDAREVRCSILKLKLTVKF